MRPLFTLLLAMLGFAGVQAQSLELKKGDNVAFVGGGLADRQQHFGHLEALIHKANADKELVAPGPRPIEIVDGGSIIEDIIEKRTA
jgi:hypothetical protein